MTKKYYDFDEIRAQNPIDEVANRLGLELKERNGQLRGPSPSGEGGERALCVTPSKGKFFDFATGEGGDVLQLVSYINKVSVKEAAQWLSEPSAPEESKKTTERPESSEGFQPLTYLDPGHPSVEAIGFDPVDAMSIGIGYAPRGLMRGLVAVPIRMPDGRLIGYIGISEARLPKAWNT